MIVNDKLSRVMPVDGVFYTKEVDDIVYGYMRYISTFNPITQEEYISEASMKDAREMLHPIVLSVSGKDSISKRTVDRKIDKLFELGFLKKSVDARNKPIVLITRNFNDRFQKVNREMLMYIISTRNMFGIKIYVYLLNKYLWKKITGEEYVFTKKELAEMLGFSANTIKSGTSPLSKIIDNNLESFSREGIIAYDEFYAKSDKGHVIPRKRLTLVAESKRELPRVVHKTLPEEDLDFSLDNNKFCKSISAEAKAKDDERLEEIGRSLEGWELL